MGLAGTDLGNFTKKIVPSLLAVAAVFAAAPAFAFSMYQLQTDGNTARYMAPGVDDNTGLQLNDNPQTNNGVMLYQDGNSSFSFSGSGSTYDSSRPDSLNYRRNQQSDPNAPFTGYYMRNR